MTEQQLIQKIKELKQIKPKQEWAILCKNQILEEMTEVRPQSFSILDIFRIPLLKPAILSITCVMILVGVFGFVQNTLPGETLYSAKKAAEQAQLNLTSKQEKPKMALELTNKKLEELSIIAEANLGKNLASAMKEVEMASQAAAQEINQEIASAPAIDDKKIEAIIEQIEQVKKIEEKKEKIGQTLGGIVDTPELDEAMDSCNKLVYKPYAEREIKDWENQTLTSEQEEILEEVQGLFSQEKYDEVLVKLFLSQ